MSTLYPTSLDAFVNPSGINILDAANPALKHATQHTNINDSMAAVQAHIGVSGSLVPESLEFRLHNVSLGHNHDGINSRPVVIGPPLSGSTYVSGVFAFTSTTRVGEAIDQINQLLFSSLSGSMVTFQYEGATQGAGGTTTTVDFVGTGVSASYVGTTTTYTVTRGLLADDRELILLAECGGPFEGYPSSFNETLMHRAVFPSASIWYTDNTKTSRIIEQELVYTGNNIVPSQSIFRVYEQDGTTVKTTSTDTIYYNGIFEISRSRSII